MGPIRVLLVDDEVEFRAVMRSSLEGDDRFEVVDEAADGHQAIALATLHQPDVVLLDLMMPELDGLAAATSIREEAPNSLIAMLSSREAWAARRAAVSAGADVFIEKHDIAAVADQLVDLVNANRG
ncbi:MAG TPA: response regulator [Acidimicrobiales bacterium]|nr:response regulator [Acidimicrobiales bacterium]